MAVDRRGASSMSRGSREQLGVGGEQSPTPLAPQISPAALHRVQRLVVERSIRSAPTWAAPAASAASAAAISRALRRAPGGVSSAARASTLARDANPPRRAAQVGDLLQPVGHRRIGADGGLGGVPRLELDQVQPRAAARQRVWIRRRSAPGAALYTADRTSGCRNRTRWPSSTRPAASASSPRLGRRPRWPAAAPDQVDVPGRVGGRDQQPPLDRRRPAAAPGEGSAPRGDDRPGSARRPGSDSVSSLRSTAPAARSISANGLPPVDRAIWAAASGVDAVRQRRGQQGDRGHRVQPAQRAASAIPASQTSSRGSSRMANSIATDSACEPAGDEGEHVERLRVEPVGVVDRADHRAVLTGRGEQAQHTRAPPGTGPAAVRRPAPVATSKGLLLPLRASAARCSRKGR